MKLASFSFSHFGCDFPIFIIDLHRNVKICLGKSCRIMISNSDLIPLSSAKWAKWTVILEQTLRGFTNFVKINAFMGSSVAMSSCLLTAPLASCYVQQPLSLTYGYQFSLFFFVVKKVIIFDFSCKLSSALQLHLHLWCSVFCDFLLSNFLHYHICSNGFPAFLFLLRVDVCSLYIKTCSAIVKHTRAIYIFNN